MPDNNEDEFWTLRKMDWWGKKWVEEVNYQDLTKETFFSRYVDSWTPVKIVGGCAQWDACTKWNDPQYVLNRWGDTLVTASDAAFHGSLCAQDIEEKETTVKLPLREVHDSNQVFSINLPLGEWQNCLSLPTDFADDFGEDKLVKDVVLPRYYPRRRMFLYRGGITPWHGHVSDDHLTYQLVGEKDFAFLPAAQMNKRTNDQKEGSIPLCTTLSPGDSIYIPPPLYHAVTPSNNEYGVTMAFTWAGSLSNHLKHMTKSNARHGIWTFIMAAKNKIGK